MGFYDRFVNRVWDRDSREDDDEYNEDTDDRERYYGEDGDDEPYGYYGNKEGMHRNSKSTKENRRRSYAGKTQLEEDDGYFRQYEQESNYGTDGVYYGAHNGYAKSGGYNDYGYTNGNNNSENYYGAQNHYGAQNNNKNNNNNNNNNPNYYGANNYQNNYNAQSNYSSNSNTYDYSSANDSYNNSNYDYSSYSDDGDFFSTTSKSKIISVKPISYADEISSIADKLIQNYTILLNFEGTKKDEIKRILDFLCGCVYVKQGKLQRVAKSIFVITPKGVDLKGYTLEEDWQSQEK